MENKFLLEQTCIKLLDEFKNGIGKNNIGLWCFKYVVAKRCLKTWHFIPIEGKAIIDESIKKLIDDTEIPEGIGSIGYMMLEKKGTIIKDTFADPRGTVLQIDSKIDQKSALCYPIIDDKKRIVVGLDFFSSEENIFTKQHLVDLISIINDYTGKFINLYNYSLEHDIFDLYNKPIEIPNRKNLESVEDFTRRSYKEFLIRSHKIASNVARIPIVELLKKNDKNNFQAESLLFDPNEIKNILLQELLLCNYKSEWATNCPIIGGNSDAEQCDCCQQPLEVLLKYFDINKGSKPKFIIYENNFYKLLIVPKKEGICFDLFFNEIDKIFNNYENDFKGSNSKKLKIKLDELKNKLIDSTKGNLKKYFDTAKLVLVFLKFKNIYRWLNDIRTIKQLDAISKNPTYLNPSTICSLVSSIDNNSMLKEYPPNIASHSDVKGIEINNLQHEIEINGNKVCIKWEQKKSYKDLFYAYINDEWVEEIIINKIPYNEIKQEIKSYLNLRIKDLELDQFTKLNIYSPYQEEIKVIWPKFSQFINNLYSFYETSILKEKAVISSMKSATAAIMSRNMSHNIGSHVLANYSQEDYNKKTINNKNINNIFNSYIQQRMDFIAGLTSGWYGVPEEMWFFKDLIYGFLKNVPLLDLIVDSHNFNRKNILFKIQINSTEYRLKICDSDENRFTIENSLPDKNDFLVGIPRGLIGNHAFYIILENIIRNSAKYGLNRPQEKLEVTVSCKLTHEEGVYDLEIYDNLSLANGDGKDIVKEIQDKIDEMIINPLTGEPNYENMGITEMKESARMLIDPYKKKYDSLNNPNQAICVGKTNDNYLKYMFRLMIPHLMTVISSKEYKPPLSEGIFYKDNPNIILSSAYNSFLFIISEDKHNRINAEIKTWYYPYRFLDFNENEVADNPDWKELFLKQYYIWIKKLLLEKEDAEYNLVISFERENEAERWQECQDTKLKEFDNLNVHIVCTEKPNNHFLFKELINSSKYKNKQEFLSAISNRKLSNFIVYDNHRNFKGLLEKQYKQEPLFCHEMGRGYEKIFGLLDYPPKDPFLLKYLLLNLWETAITKILIIDERIAESYIEESVNKISTKKVKKDEQFLKISTIFYIEINGNKYFVSEKVKSAYNNSKSELTGLKLEDRNWRIVKGEGNYENDKKYEICIMHQGVVDECIVPNIKNNNWFYGYKNICKHFVVTSGRGKFIKHIPEDLAFIEFSVLKENFLDDQSKLHLLKALSMTKGGKKDD